MEITDQDEMSKSNKSTIDYKGIIKVHLSQIYHIITFYVLVFIKRVSL